MGNFVGLSRVYNIHAENEVAEILSHFNSQLIASFLDSKIKSRESFNPVIANVNDVGALEQNFKQIVDAYPEEQQQIWMTRNRVYQEIIDSILIEYNLKFNPTYESNSGSYMEALLLYDFFVSRYVNNAIEFFSTAIFQNINSIYKYLDTDERRDATVYAKKIYNTNPKLAIIANNINIVLDIICGFDYTIDDIFKTLYILDDYNVLTSCIIDRDDFFKHFYVGLVKGPLRPTIITEIRMNIHSRYIEENGVSSPVNNIMEDK